jgi:hypothetical protein
MMNPGMMGNPYANPGIFGPARPGMLMGAAPGIFGG